MLERIVIGVDESAGAAMALRWGVEEATAHGVKATALLAWSFLAQHHADRSDAFDRGYEADDARAALAADVRAALGNTDVVTHETRCDLPVHALLTAAETADLVVVGARGSGGFEDLLLGSVSEQVAEHATHPVAVVRAPAPVMGARVVVGIDGSERSLAALRWAAGEADVRQSELHVVHTWHLPATTPSPWLNVAVDPAEVRRWGREVLEQALAEPALAGVKATGHLREGGAARTLLTHAGEASLIVVGARGHSGLAGMLLGSVSRQLLHHASCPVVVV